MLKCEKDLKFLSNASDYKKREIIHNCKKCLIKAIAEISKNCLVGNISMNKCKKIKLRRYNKLLKFLSMKSSSLNIKRKAILQTGTGFLNILLPLALETLATIYNNTVASRR